MVLGRSFVEHSDVQDKAGHGTHCIGVACGPRRPVNPKYPRRYGVACEAAIHAGKVLGNDGFGYDRVEVLLCLNQPASNAS